MFHWLNSSYPRGGWTSWLKRSTILPSRTRVAPTAQTEARLEFAVSKSMAVKSSMRVSVCLVIDGGSLLTVAGVHAELWGTSLDAPKWVACVSKDTR